MKKLQKLKSNKGITLVALVVTIVILLILAGVSINLVLGENGLIAKAKEARNAVRDDNENILVGMNNLYDEMEAAINGGNAGVVEDPYKDNEEDLKDTLKIGYPNEDDVIAYLYSNDTGNYDVVIRGTGDTRSVFSKYCDRLFPDYAIEKVYITEGVTSLGMGMFWGCVSSSTLKEVNIPSSLKSIGETAFADCTSLENITIPDSVTSIEGSAFADCTNLTGSITIPSGVTTIERNTFKNCKNLERITIPDSVTSIETYAFDNCTSLTDVYYAGSETDWEAITIDDFSNGNDYLTGATIYYNSIGPESN